MNDFHTYACGVRYRRVNARTPSTVNVSVTTNHGRGHWGFPRSSMLNRKSERHGTRKVTQKRPSSSQSDSTKTGGCNLLGAAVRHRWAETSRYVAPDGGRRSSVAATASGRHSFRAYTTREYDPVPRAAEIGVGNTRASRRGEIEK